MWVEVFFLGIFDHLSIGKLKADRNVKRLILRIGIENKNYGV